MNENIILIITAVGLGLAALAVYKIRTALRQEITVWEHCHALHYRHGVLKEVLRPGRHVFWGRGHAFRQLEARWEEAVIQGQEFLTSDRAPVKVSGVARYRIADPEKNLAAASHPYQGLHTAVQLALRDVIGALGIDAVLEAKHGDLTARLTALVKPVAEALGYELDTIAVRDLMLCGELKKAFTQSMTAKQEALAELEKARGEAAALRVMANAARVFDQHPALLQLKFIQSLEHGTGHQHQFIMGSLDPWLGFMNKK